LIGQTGIGMNFTRNIRIFFGILSAGMSTADLHAQDPAFSQFYNNPIYYNPGYIGLNPGFRARCNYRDQWTGLPADFRTFTFSMDLAERNIPGSGGLGLLFMNDNAGSGLIKTTNIGLGTSARVPLNDYMLVQLGMMVSFVQKKLNLDGLVFSDQLNPRLGIYRETTFQSSGKTQDTYPDFNFGGVYRFNKRTRSIPSIQGTLGIALHHAFKPNESFLGLDAPLPSRLTITGDVIMEVSDAGNSPRGRFRNQGAFKLDPSFIWEKQSDFQSFAIGCNVLKSSLYLGGWYRKQLLDTFIASDLILVLGINANINDDSRIKVMYSYDYIVSDLRSAARSSHEISLVLEFDQFSLFGNKRSAHAFRGRNYKEMDCVPF
jgi:type IX secretion system PorP/SprF family membrane protein